MTWKWLTSRNMSHVGSVLANQKKSTANFYALSVVP